MTLIKKIKDKKVNFEFNKEYINLYYSGFYTFLNANYGSFIPYIVDSKNNIHIDKTQNVRNVATIHDSLYFNKHLKKHVKKSIINNLNYYKTKFDHNKEDMRQASAFLLLALQKLRLHPETIKIICKYLYNSIPHLEEKFELGEVLIALNTVCPIKQLLLNEQREMYYALVDKKRSKLGDIFQYNWQAKFLYSLYIQGLTKNSKNSHIRQHANELIDKIFNILPQIDEHSETNYLAVTFEALHSLLPLIPNKKDRVLIKDNLLNLFYMLQNRYKNGLFYFNNNTARLDITGHVINGLLVI